MEPRAGISLRRVVATAVLLAATATCKQSFDASETTADSSSTAPVGTDSASEYDADTAEGNSGLESEGDQSSEESETSVAEDFGTGLSEPIARWTFDGDFDDEFGFNDGVLDGSASFEAGLEGQALRLEPGSWVEIYSFAPTFRDHLDDFSIFGIVFVDDDTVPHKLWCLGANVESDAPASNSLHILSRDEGFQIFTETALGENHQALVGPKLSAGSWHRFAVSVTGSNAALFVDGESVGASTFQVPETSSNVLSLGGAVDPGAEVFAVVGLIDEIAFYDHAMTVEDATLLTGG